MANRAYLYSVGRIPKETQDPTLVNGLSEYNWGIPLAYKLLVSAEVELCKSIIWQQDDNIALIGNYDQGVKNLDNFLKEFGKLDIKDKQTFEKYHHEALSFLKDQKNRQWYILLEAGEIFDMTHPDIPKQAKELFEEVKQLQFRTKDLMSGLKETWEKDLGVDYWADVLYYHFK